MARCPSISIGGHVGKAVRRFIADLQRRPPSLEPRRRFVLFCEGKNTEPGYFGAIKRSCKSTFVDIESIPAVGVPSTIAKEATDYVRSLPRRRKHSFEAQDEVWAVFDRDEHDNFEEAVRRCQGKGVKVARSNPCFELWLILHEKNFDAVLNRHQIQAELARIRPDYDMGGSKTLDFDDMVMRVGDAENRAARQLARRKEERIPYNNPSTTVGILTAAIRNADAKSR